MVASERDSSVSELIYWERQNKIRQKIYMDFVLKDEKNVSQKSEYAFEYQMSSRSKQKMNTRQNQKEMLNCHVIS